MVWGKVVVTLSHLNFDDVGVLQQNMCLCEKEAAQQEGWVYMIQLSASVPGWQVMTEMISFQSPSNILVDACLMATWGSCKSV